MSSRDHLALAAAYSADVLSGRVAACAFVRQACARQRADLERWRSGGPYEWSPEHAGRVCRFLELFPHVKGPKANEGELLVLEPWQAFLVSTVFGWRRRDTGARRFRRAYVEVPRGNGKSMLCSGLALYGLAGEGEQGAEVYAAATSKAQARIVWGTAKAMLRRSPRIARRLGLIAGREQIAHGRSNSTFAAMTRDAPSQEGQNVHLAIVDELHVHPTRDLWDLLETATSKRPNSLLWAITTAGADTAGICYELRDYCLGVLEGRIADESQFALVYTLDASDDWSTEESWRKANPNWGVSVDPVNVSALAAKALTVPSARSNFRRKHLNVWVGGDETWIPLEAWDAGADASLRLDDFAGAPCWIGLDLASKVDLAAAALLFERVERGGVRHLYLFVRCYLPEAAARAARNAQYSGWVASGHVRTTPGDVLDFEVIRRDLLADARRFHVRQVGFDPWQATQLATELLRGGVPMIEVPQTARSLSEPMKEFGALVLSGRLHHDANPAMRWMLSNVVRREDESNGNIRPAKERRELKIDGVVAALIALNRVLATAGAPEASNPYEVRGLRSLQ